MEIKKAIYKIEQQEVRVCVSDAVYGCDECKKETGDERLRITVFSNDDEETKDHEFCSWKCVLKFLPKIECDYFVNLPYLHYDNKEPGTKAEDFIKLLDLQ